MEVFQNIGHFAFFSERLDVEFRIRTSVRDLKSVRDWKSEHSDSA